MSSENVTMRARATGWASQGLQLAGIVLAVFIAKGAIAEPFYVPSGSMEPTLLIGDALLASKFPYGYGTASLPMQLNLPETGRVFEGTPKPGDVVVFRWPGDRAQAWVKRVVGVPGDRIQMRQGQLFVNDHPAALKPDGMGEAEDDNGNVERAYRYVETLPDGGVGLLPIDNLVGRADAVVGSWDLGMRSQPVWTWLSGFRMARFFTAVH